MGRLPRAAEEAGRWFAAAFHLGRLIGEMPADAAVCAHRCRAEVRLDRWQPAADFLQALSRWPPDDDAPAN